MPSGPDHMAPFVNDPVVQQKFKSVALQRSISDMEGTKYTLSLFPFSTGFRMCIVTPEETEMEPAPLAEAVHPLEAKPLVLFSKNPDDYIADVLYALLPSTMNPEGAVVCCYITVLLLFTYVGIKGFYSDPENKPSWFPEHIPFQPPTHRGMLSLSYVLSLLRVVLHRKESWRPKVQRK